MSYSALARTDDEAGTGGVNDSSRDGVKVIHPKNSLDPGEESRQEPEVSSGHPNEACYYSGTCCFRDVVIPYPVERRSQWIDATLAWSLLAGV